MIREMTCIVCPMGCNLTVELDGNKVVSVSGNTCKRGEIYANNECTNPQRTVTSTVKCSNGAVCAVKTDKTIPKEKMAECMEVIAMARPTLPISIGDIIIKDAGRTAECCKHHKRGFEN